MANPRELRRAPGRIAPVMAEAIGDLAFQNGLQQPFRQLLEQSALAGDLRALGLGAAHPVDQLLIQGQRPL
ncbi:hypothetical protein ACFQ6Q_03145 [Streptomyces sp. NPDC056437]|uniref:hypothetical protein n=1 Tax=Streptomyces sp. NPDC056437 TaxID=3345816 RepID=UPI0036C69205